MKLTHSVWPVVKLRTICQSFQPGFAREPNDLKDGVLQLRMPNISRSGFVDLSVAKFVDASNDERSKYAVRTGDVVFNNTNSPELVGNAAVFDHEIECVLSNHMTRIRVNEELLIPAYLAVVLHQYWKTEQTQKRAKQWINQAAIDVESLANFRIPLPALSEQQQIVDILIEAEKVRRLRAQAEAKTAELIPAMFHAEFVLKGDYKYAPLDTLADVVSGVAIGRNLRGFTQEISYLRVANVQAGYADLSEVKTTPATDEEVEAFGLHIGDVLLTEGGDFDKLGRGCLWEGQIAPCIHQNHIFRVRPLQGKLNPQFFAHYLQSARAKQYFLRCAKRTTNLASINLTQLKALPVPVISMNEQHRFERSVGIAEECQAGESTDVFNRLAASLSASAFSGQLTADWREKNQAKLATETRKRDEELAILSGKPVMVNFSMADSAAEAELFNLPDELNREQKSLLFNIKARQLKKAKQYTPSYFTAEQLAAELNGSLHRNPQVIEAHLSVFAARGLIIPVSREEQTKDTGEYVFGNAYRLPIGDKEFLAGERTSYRAVVGTGAEAISERIPGDFSRLREMERLIMRLEKERMLT